MTTFLILTGFKFSQVLIYLLVNPRSGSREGRAYTELEKTQYFHELKNGDSCELNIVNILKPEAMQEFKDATREKSNLLNSVDESEELKKLIVVIVGGDGSFMNILKEMEDYGCVIESIIFTQFPFGTANDLSRAFKWGATPTRKMKHDIGYLCDKLNEAKETGFDIWEIVIQTDEDLGDIESVDNNELVSQNTKEFKKLM